MSDAKLTVDTIAELQETIATQREVICNLTAMNDELQAKLDKIKEIMLRQAFHVEMINGKEYRRPLNDPEMYNAIKEILGI